MSIICLNFFVCGQLSILPNPSNLAPGSPVRLNIGLDWVSLWCSPHTAALTFSWGISHSDSYTFPLRTSHPVVFQCALTTSLSFMFDWQGGGQGAVDRTNQTGLGLKFPSTVQGPGAALALLCRLLGNFGCLGCSTHLAPAARWERARLSRWLTSNPSSLKMTSISYAARHSSFLLFLSVCTFCSSLEPWHPSLPLPLLLVLCFILIKWPEQSGENPPQPHPCISLTRLPPVTVLPSLPSPSRSCTRLISAYSGYKLQHFSLFLRGQSPPSLLNRSRFQYRCPLSLPHCNIPGGCCFLLLSASPFHFSRCAVSTVTVKPFSRQHL